MYVMEQGKRAKMTRNEGLIAGVFRSSRRNEHWSQLDGIARGLRWFMDITQEKELYGHSEKETS